MCKWLYSFAGLVILMQFNSCANRICVKDVSTVGIEIQVSSIIPKELINKWYWSYEDDKQDGLRTYRVSTFDFPLSRGRSGFEICKNGKFVVLEAGADDKPINYEGQWIYDKNSNSIEVSFKKLALESENSTITTENRNPFVINIISYDQSMLKVKVTSQAKSSSK